MHQKHQQQQQAHDQNTNRLCSFLPGDAVAVHLFRGQEKWTKGEVIQCLGPVSYMVRINKVSHVHINHLVAATETIPLSNAQLAAAPPENPLRSKSQYAEVYNPAHALDLTPEVLPPVPKPTRQGQQRSLAHLPRHQTCLREGWQHYPTRSWRGPPQDDITLSVPGSFWKDWLSESSDCTSCRQDCTEECA